MGHANITIAGSLTRDPETKPLGSTDMTTFSIPVETGFGDKKTTTWYNIKAFGKQGDTIAQYMRKGSFIIVSGEPMLRSYTDRSGNAKTTLEVRLQAFSFGPKSSGSGGGERSSSRTSSRNDEIDDDEIPF